MKPFILYYAEKTSTDSEQLLLDYSDDLNLSVIPSTNEPAINLAASSLETFTKAGKEPTDYSNLGKQSIVEGNTFTRSQETTDPFYTKSAIEGETRTFTKSEVTDRSSQISRITKRMSLESLTEAREATDVK